MEERLYKSKPNDLSKNEPMNLAESLRKLSDRLDQLTSKNHINESKNSYRHTTLNEGGAMPGVGPIHISEINPTLTALQKKLGLDLKNNTLGSVGKKEFSGDIDIAVDIDPAEAAKLAERLKTIPEILDLSRGSVISTKVKIANYDPSKKSPDPTKPRTGYVQIDFMFGNPQWLKDFYHAPYEKDSKYKGVHRNILISAIAAHLDKIESKEKIDDGRPVISTRWMWSPTNALVRIERTPEKNKKGNGYTKKNDNRIIAGPYRDLNDVAKHLRLNSADNLYSYETLRKAMDKNYSPDLIDQILKDFANNDVIKELGVPEDIKEYTLESKEWFKNIKNRLSDLTEARDASPRIPHPEDAIFTSQAEALKYEQALEDTITGADKISIKWDGGIALFFGTSPEGKFFINDKYMPDGFYAYSPQDWERYDTTIKKSRTARPDLYNKIAVIWKGLQQSVTDTGIYKGDLMDVSDGKALQPVNGNFQFKPTTVTYNVPAASPLGKLIQNKVGVIVVHQRNGAPWDGKTGLENRSNVAIIPPKAGVQFKLKNPGRLATDARNAVLQQGPIAEKFLNGMAKTAKDSIQKYFNHKITSQTNEDLLPWLQKEVSGKQYQLLTAYIKDNSEGMKALEKVWNSVYKLKENLVSQLEKQVSGFSQTINGQPGGEGFVVPTRAGLVKLVNRMQFGSAHFNK